MHPSPLSLPDVLAARDRLRPYLATTPFRNYPLLDECVGHGITVWVKHENHQPTQSFKIRNGISALTALSAEQRARGVIAPSTGNHGQGVAYAGRLLGVPVAICVPLGNNPEKNASIRAMGAELIEEGENYDETSRACTRIQAERGCTLIHGINNRDVLAGAATMTFEIVEQKGDLDALLIAVGGGSQAVGAITVAAALRPSMAVWAVGADEAPAQYLSWKQGERLAGQPVRTFAEGIATGAAYEMTFDTLKAGLAGFVTVSEAEMYQGIRDLLRITHNVPEGAGAAGFAGLHKLAGTLAGKRVGIVMCGGNLSTASLKVAVCG